LDWIRKWTHVQLWTHLLARQLILDTVTQACHLIEQITAVGPWDASVNRVDPFIACWAV